MSFCVYCRYLINYAPFDCFYKLCKFSPMKLIISVLNEFWRAHNVYYAMLFALKHFPGSTILVCIIGVLKGEAHNIGSCNLCTSIY